MAWVNPGCPNLTDYLSFLYGIVGIPQVNYPSVAGTATGGSTLTLVDATQNWAVNQWQQVPSAAPNVPAGPSYDAYDTSQGSTGSIASNTATTLTFASALAQPVNAGDAYIIAADTLSTTLCVALEIVSRRILYASPTMYTLAVYNLAADRLLNYATDVPTQTYFQDQRVNLRVTDVSVGVPSQASDQGTAVGLLNPVQMRIFTLMDLQALKTPQGREYMSIAMSYGQDLWGLT